MPSKIIKLSKKHAWIVVISNLAVWLVAIYLVPDRGTLFGLATLSFAISATIIGKQGSELTSMDIQEKNTPSG